MSTKCATCYCQICSDVNNAKHTKAKARCNKAKAMKTKAKVKALPRPKVRK